MSPVASRPWIVGVALGACGLVGGVDPVREVADGGTFVVDEVGPTARWTLTVTTDGDVPGPVEVVAEVSSAGTADAQVSLEVFDGGEAIDVAAIGGPADTDAGAVVRASGALACDAPPCTRSWQVVLTHASGGAVAGRLRSEVGVGTDPLVAHALTRDDP